MSERVRLDAEMWGGPYDGELVRLPMCYPYRFFREQQDGRRHWYAYDPETRRASYEGEREKRSRASFDYHSVLEA